MHSLSPDFSKRDYLLPPGCSNLTDLPKLPVIPKPGRLRRRREPPPAPRVVHIGAAISLNQLALLLHLGVFQVVLDIMGICGFHGLNQVLPFEVAAQVARKHGFVPKVAHS